MQGGQVHSLIYPLVKTNERRERTESDTIDTNEPPRVDV